MKTQKDAGIWLDHSTANLMDITAKESNDSLTSNFTFNTKEEALNKSEKLMHNKRQQMNEAFYKEIESEILNYQHILLFGPTNAKTELYNYLSKDAHFGGIKIDVKNTDNITANEKVAFVKSHFNV
jgi:stalled ribosome rescue protein Dom34